MAGLLNKLKKSKSPEQLVASMVEALDQGQDINLAKRLSQIKFILYGEEERDPDEARFVVLCFHLDLSVPVDEKNMTGTKVYVYSRVPHSAVSFTVCARFSAVIIACHVVLCCRYLTLPLVLYRVQSTSTWHITMPG